MKKREEIDRPDSCLNKAAEDEPVFVLRAKDPAAVMAVWEWIDKRISLGLNRERDAKLIDAWNWCTAATKWREDNGR